MGGGQAAQSDRSMVVKFYMRIMRLPDTHHNQKRLHEVPLHQEDVRNFLMNGCSPYGIHELTLSVTFCDAFFCLEHVSSFLTLFFSLAHMGLSKK